jgi:hypothetical protein
MGGYRDRDLTREAAVFPTLPPPILKFCCFNTVKKVIDFPVPSRHVTYQTLRVRELFSLFILIIPG